MFTDGWFTYCAITLYCLLAESYETNNQTTKQRLLDIFCISSHISHYNG